MSLRLLADTPPGYAMMNSDSVKRASSLRLMVVALKGLLGANPGKILQDGLFVGRNSFRGSIMYVNASALRVKAL